MEELNKKLAEWAGFTWQPYSQMPDGSKKTDACWLYPDGDWSFGYPSFTQSLDACFKWLVSKLDIDEISFSLAGEDWLCILTCWHTEDGYIGHYPKQEEEAETPALAFCLAVEKLIDGEKDA